MKILITGGDGFIARSLFEQLRFEYAVFSYNRKELVLEIYQCSGCGLMKLRNDQVISNNIEKLKSCSI